MAAEGVTQGAANSRLRQCKSSGLEGGCAGGEPPPHGWKERTQLGGEASKATAKPTEGREAHRI